MFGAALRGRRVWIKAAFLRMRRGTARFAAKAAAGADDAGGHMRRNVKNIRFAVTAASGECKYAIIKLR